MSLIGRGRNWLRSIAARRRLEREMLEEMRAHIEQAAERFRARGMSERDALLAAKREFGQPGVVQEQARDARGSRWVDSTAADLRYAVRHFARAPLSTLTIVLTLTLGIGVTASMFSVMDGVFNRPAPGVPDDWSLVRIRGIEVAQNGPRHRSISWPEVTEYAALTDRFDAVAAWTTRFVIADFGDGLDGVRTVSVQFVSPNFFSTLGIRLATGPGFVQKAFQDLAEPELTAIASQSFAAERLGGVANAVGKEVKLNGVAVRIVGVAPRRFNGATPANVARGLWLPLSSYRVVMSSSQPFASRDTSIFWAMARLQPGVTSAAATEAAKVVSARVNAARGPRQRLPFTSDVVPLRGTMDVRGIDPESLEVSAIFGVLVLLILLVCTTTVSSLLVGAAVSRRQEIAVRLALGASRARVIRQLLTETTMLAIAGGALGLVIFGWACRLLAGPLINVDVTPDWGTAGFTVLFAVMTALLCGLSPALHATRSGVADVLKDGALGATSRTRLQRTFVVAQIALTQPLLVGLAMMISLSVRGLGPRPGSALGDRVVLAYFDLYPTMRANSPDPMPDVVKRIASLPGVMSVLPQGTGYGLRALQVAAVGSTPPETFKVRTVGVPPDYFRTLDIPLVRGREFTAADLGRGAPSRVILGSDAATRLFGAVSPIGQRLYERSAAGVTEFEVVGVVPAELVGASDENPQLRVFVPYAARSLDALLIRTTVPAEPLLPTFRAVVHAEAPNVPINSMETLAQDERDKRKELLQAAGASAGGGVIALLLASIGLYAVVAIAVGQRRREIGVRVAVGASPGQVVALFFNSGLRLSLLGLLIGLPLSAAALKLLAVRVGMPPTNTPAIALLIGMVVVAVAALATWLPARRAAGVDPLIALRAE